VRQRIAKGLPRLEQYDRQEDRLDQSRFDKDLLEDLETVPICTRFGAPPGYGETKSVGWNEL
jgi:hypothetical protein